MCFLMILLVIFPLSLQKSPQLFLSALLSTPHASGSHIGIPNTVGFAYYQAPKYMATISPNGPIIAAITKNSSRVFYTRMCIIKSI